MYNKYTDVHCNESKEKKEESCLSIIINKEEELIELIGSCSDGNIRIWNFHSGELLHKIMAHNGFHPLRGICLWNNDYLLVGLAIIQLN